MKNSKNLSTLALVLIVFVAWACSCPRNMNFNNSNNSNNSNNRNANNSNNSNSSNNSNRTTVPSDFVTEFIVSKEATGSPETVFGSTDKIYLTFSVRNMPAAKGLKGKLVADTVAGVQSGSSVEVTKDTRKGESIRKYSFYFTPTPIWHAGTYHLELILINEDGTEGILKTQDISVS